jgi:glycosyltransferase involved in cell wall biosynthesis
MVTTFYPPYHFGGDAVYVQRLATELGRRGHHVDVVHDLDSYYLLHPGEPSIDSPPAANVTVHRLKSPFGPLSPLATHQTGLPLLKPGLRRLLESGGHDVIHFHNASLVGSGAFRYGDAIKLYTMHEQWLVCPMHLLWQDGRRLCETRRCVRCCLRGRRPPQLWRATGALRRHVRAIDQFLAPSRFVRDAHRERGLDLPTTVLPLFLPDTPPVPSDETPPHSGPYFLFVGRLVTIKGLQTLLEAFRDIQSADLLVAGEGDDGPALRAAARDMSHVRFLGAQPFERLRSLYRHAIALVVPSLCYEVGPMVMSEAFAEATPVIARESSGMAEAITESRGGLLFRDTAELRVALARLQADPELRHTLGQNARRTFVEHHTADVHIARYLAVIDACRASRQAAPGGRA